MANDEESSIRVKRSTLHRLRAAICRLVEAVECNQRTDPGLTLENINPRALALSYDAMLNLLLDAREQHQERAKQSRARRRQQRNGEATA